LAASRGVSRRFAREVERVVGATWCLTDASDRWAYSYDASLARSAPDIVAVPGTEEEVARLVRLCHRERVPFVARGAGTGIAGGAVPIAGGLVISMARMKRILAIEPDDLVAVVEPGVVNLELDRALAPLALAFVPDPSSQQACTIGGNVANNSGGPHCLAYGVTTHHVRGLRVVMPDGELVDLGGPWAESPGYDLTGLFVGSEGTLGIATRILCRLTPRREAVATLLAAFAAMESAAAAVSRIIARGVVPAALEMMDGPIIRAVEESVHAGYPVGAAAVLLVELEGLAEALPDLVTDVRGLLVAAGAASVREARSEAERQTLWAGRKGALGAAARLAPRYYLQDGVVPRTQLLPVLSRIAQIGRELELTIVNVFHAGDGNLHPLVLFDPADPEQTRRAAQAGERIMRACVDAGGTLSGEHGIGLEKNNFMPWVFGPADLEAMARVRAALDPLGLANPGKVLPSPVSCHEILAAPDLAAGGLWV
jgi:glycolate oxidase